MSSNCKILQFCSKLYSFRLEIFRQAAAGRNRSIWQSVSRDWAVWIVEPAVPAGKSGKKGSEDGDSLQFSSNCHSRRSSANRYRLTKCIGVSLLVKKRKGKTQPGVDVCQDVSYNRIILNAPCGVITATGRGLSMLVYKLGLWWCLLWMLLDCGELLQKSFMHGSTQSDTGAQPAPFQHMPMRALYNTMLLLIQWLLWELLECWALQYTKTI